MSSEEMYLFMQDELHKGDCARAARRRRALILF